MNFQLIMVREIIGQVTEDREVSGFLGLLLFAGKREGRCNMAGGYPLGYSVGDRKNSLEFLFTEA